ncbi:uncharacterized protein LOC107459462 [Arachis duranensis]|uniref:Uncharacterized protein LOC107459462 n=1 Tax=Arachis duranensis TaxID=130453 RepID=A0A6P4B6Y2_ARADU|nr:uncharacterized protein LOC107459462 [Arachis duranensis]
MEFTVQRSILGVQKVLKSTSNLTRPIVGKELVLYLSVVDKAVASALIREDEVEQHPIYFTSKVLQGPELRYQKLEKFAYSLVVASHRLRPYFQARTIKVRTNQPMKQILQKKDIARRMVQWAIELSKFDLKYKTRMAIKSQCLTDFIAEYAGDKEEESTTWELYIDGFSNKMGSGASIILVNKEGTQIEIFLKFEFSASNNQAEYEALIAGLKLAEEVGVTKVMIFSDSQVVTSQINEEYQAKDPNMKRYLEKTLEYLRRFAETEIKHITRDLNSRADSLSKLASTKPGGNNKSLIQKTLQEPSVVKIEAKQDVLEISGSDLEWMNPLVEYLKFDILPKEEKEAKKIQREEQSYTLVKNILYKRGISTPLLKCVPTSRTAVVLEEVHNGICGNHLGDRSLARKVIRAGFYWPILQKDTTEFMKKCQPCQMHANFHVAPPEELISITSPWLFTKWGLDLLGPFPQAPGQVKYLIVRVDYFTKWIEAEPLATITAQRSRKFPYKNIITRYGVPHSITTDNGTQFTDSIFRNLVANMKIKHQFTSVEHP